MKHIYLILLFVLSPFCDYAQTFEINDIEYLILGSSANHVKARGYSETSLTKDVIIPSNVTFNGVNYTVTSIGTHAFSHKELTSVIIPNTVTSIGNFAFFNNNLTNLMIPNSVVSIELAAFEKNQLENVTISNNISRIEQRAFQNNKLTSVTIPNSVQVIEEAAFRDNKLTNVTIPNGVTSIQKFAFLGNDLKNITIPSSVTHIGGSAFADNFNLRDVNSLSLDPASINVFTFFKSFGVSNTVNLTIPNGAIQAYSQEGWTTGVFNSITDGVITIDDTNPTTTSSKTPKDNASEVPIITDIVLNFNEAIVFGTGNIVLRDLTTNSNFLNINVANPNNQITINGSTLTINPDNNLDENHEYALRIPVTAIKDLNGNSYAGITTNEGLNFTTEDKTNPILISSTPVNNTTRVATTDNITLTFSEPIKFGIGGIVLRDLTNNNVLFSTDAATPDSQFSISENTLTINPDVDLAESTTYAVNIVGTAIKDNADNNFIGINNNTTLSFTTADETKPSITSITRQNPTVSPTNVNTLIWNVTFNEAVKNINAVDFEISGTTANISSVINQSGNTYRITASGGNLANLNGAVTLGFSGSQNITDIAGNSLSNLTPTDTNNTTFVLDNTTPRIESITRQTPINRETNVDIVVWDVTFNEAVRNVNTSDFTISGTTATATNVTNTSGNKYRVTFSGGNLANFNGNIVIGFSGGQDIADTAGNSLTNLTRLGVNENRFVIDNIAPRVTSIIRQTPTTSPTNANTLIWNVTFNEAVKNINAVDFSISGTTANISSVINQSGTTYRVTASGGNLANLNGTVTLGFSGSQNITDIAGNSLSNLTPTSINNTTFVLDNTTPRIESITRQTPTNRETNVDIVVWDVTFNEAVRNVNTPDFTISGTTATATNVTNTSGNKYRVTFSGGNLANFNGNIVIGFSGGQDIADTAGNSLTNLTRLGVNENRFVIDNIAPRVTSITRQNPINRETNVDIVVWDVTFNEAVRNVNTSDFTITGTTATATNVTNTSGNKYRVTFSGGNLSSFNGNIVIRFSEDQDIADIAGNSLTNLKRLGANENRFLIDNSAPIVQSIALTGTPDENTDTLDYTIRFNENANNITIDDFELTTTGTATGNIASVSAVSGIEVTVTVTEISANSTGTIRLDLKESTDIIDDLANNGTPAFINGEIHNIDFTTLGLDDNIITKDELYVSSIKPILKINTAYKVDEIRIYNNIGYTVATTKNNKTITIDNLTNGVYFIKIKTNNQIVTKKIVIE